MNDETKQMVKEVLILVIVVIVVAIGMILLYHYVDKPRQEWCESHNIDRCIYFNHLKICYFDCDELGLKYFRVEDGGFGAGNFNCWCRNDNSTKQIW